MINVLFAAGPDRWEEWEAPLRDALAAEDVAADLSRDHAPDATDAIVFAPNPDLTDFTPYTRARAVLSLWAGVETIVDNPTLTQPLARMVDPGLTEGMCDYVAGHVLRHHLGLDADIGARAWRPRVPPLARERSVGVLGLGALGSAAARSLATLGFDVHGWSRTPKEIEGVSGHAGAEGLDAVLRRAEILVLLLPLTDATAGLIDAAALARLPPGAALVNPGRGGLVVEDDLLAALDGGRLSHATLDVFRTEPLPGDHPFWAHERVTVTPHIASATRPATASRAIARDVARLARGEAPLHLVDRARGY